METKRDLQTREIERDRSSGSPEVQRYRLLQTEYRTYKVKVEDSVTDGLRRLRIEV